MSELTYDIEEYRTSLLARQRNYQEYTKTLFLVAVITFAVGAVLLYLDMIVAAVVILALSVFFYQGSSHHHLLDDMLDAQWSLALLINRQATQLEVLRWELRKGVRE